MRGLAPRSSRPRTHRGRQWTPADALRVFAICGEMRWRGENKRRGVQVDHMTLSIDGKVFKEFRAVRPKTRRQHAQVFSRATSGVASARNPSKSTA